MGKLSDIEKTKRMSAIPPKEWEYDSIETDYGPTYSVIKVDDRGVTWCYFNDHQNVASWGYHSGNTLSFDEFMKMPNHASKTPNEILEEVRVYITQYRDPKKS